MKIVIDTETRIADIQNQFSEEFPYLKVDFYTKEHAEEELSDVADMIPPEELVSSLNKNLESGNIDIGGQRTVAQVEKEVYDKFGIAMQVSRKSGNIWLQTSKTDDRTLDKQNESGKAMEKS